MRLHQRPEIFYSALAQHFYDSSYHFILFDSTSIITPAKGLMQVFRKTVEKLKHLHQKVAVNRDMGETSPSLIYDKIINPDRFHINPQIFVVQSNKISGNNLPGKRLAFKSARWNCEMSFKLMFYFSVTLSPLLRKGHHILVLCFVLRFVFCFFFISLFCTEDGQAEVLTEIFA